MLEDIRAVARMLLDTGPPTRDLYIAAVVRDALKKHGDKPETRMHAERTARYLWSRRLRPLSEHEGLGDPLKRG